MFCSDRAISLETMMQIQFVGDQLSVGESSGSLCSNYGLW